MKRFAMFLVTSVLVTTYVSGPVMALTDERRAFYAANDILYYDDSDVAAGGGGVCIEAEVSDIARNLIEAANIPYYVEQNRAAYEYGAAQAGIPWQVLAAIHWREAGLQANKSIANGQPLGSGVSIDSQPIGDTLAEDAVIAANKVLNIGRNVYGVDILSSNSISDFAQAFLAYNRGFMYKRNNTDYNVSPYVMNGFDENHQNMVWVDADDDLNADGVPDRNPPLSGKVDGNKIGALTVFVYLMGGGVSGQDCFGSFVSVDGYVFPIGSATKSNLTKHSPIPCNDPRGCHYGSGTDPAFDIGKAGDTVVAIASGKVVSVSSGRNGDAMCNGVTYQRLDNDTPTAMFWYGHITAVSGLVAGQRLNAGDPIGTVSANAPCHDYSTPHLHIDMSHDATSYSPRMTRNGSGGLVLVPGTRNVDLIQIINKTFEALP